jgi:hypothetical protein
MKKIDRTLTRIWNWLKNLDWKSPSVIIAALCIGLLPFVARYYVFTGLFMGLILALSVLWPLEKAPEGMKRVVVAHPLAADLILSTLATVLIGSYFGSGLILGIAATFCGVVLSYLLPMIKLKPVLEPVTVTV